MYTDAALEACQKHIGKRFEDGLEFTPAMRVGCPDVHRFPVREPGSGFTSGALGTAYGYFCALVSLS